jgi:glycosyltransferase involved in cell wall biosynthesis
MMSILIPCKNEPNIDKMLEEIERYFPEAEIITCSDRDGRGKGWAVRNALQYATGDIICLIDGDMDIHPRMIKRLIPFLEDYDIVVGKKQVRGILSRRILTRLTRIFLRILFGISVDTQTGIKLFRRYALKPWNTNGYMFDLEILIKSKQANSLIIEVPVEVMQSKKMKLNSVIKCLIEVIKIRFQSRTN